MSLSIGGVTLTLEELPESVNFGGEQVLAIRKFPGGGMDIQVMGSFDDPISWSGICMFENAKDRLIQIGAFRVQAKPVTLECSFITRTVIVTKFQYDYTNDYNIPYRITVQPIINSTTNGSATSEQNQTMVSNSQQQVAQTNEAPQTFYVVKGNDTLWGIAANLLSDGSKWPTIAHANNISDPKSLIVGSKLIIPT